MIAWVMLTAPFWIPVLAALIVAVVIGRTAAR
jgi:hypothetical protein